MILRNMTLEQFAENIRQKKQKIVIYGYGAIGKVAVPAFMAANRLEAQILFYADADMKKQGQRIRVGNRQVEVAEPDRMREIGEAFVVVITGSRFEGILESLNSRSYLDNVECCIFPRMLAEAAGGGVPVYRRKRSSEPLIPKVIHYCWFGHGEMPDEAKACMASWRKYCPEYVIKEWNERNYNVNKYLYSSQAYRHGKWAFVADMARLDILYENGGIYLDTDVELIKSLDDLLYQPAFCAVEKWRQMNTGGGCGAVAHHPAIRKMLEHREKIPFEYPDGTLNMETNGVYESMPLMEAGFVPDNTIQVVEDMTIYSSDFFFPFDYMSKETVITGNTYAVHRFQGSWN